jgi:hypothetical protein
MSETIEVFAVLAPNTGVQPRNEILRRLGIDGDTTSMANPEGALVYFGPWWLPEGTTHVRFTVTS